MASHHTFRHSLPSESTTCDPFNTVTMILSFCGTAKTCIEQPMIQVAASLTVEEQKEDVACWANFVEACQPHLLNQLKSSWTNETPIQFAIFQCITMYFSPVSWYTVFPRFACLQTLLRVSFSMWISYHWIERTQRLGTSFNSFSQSLPGKQRILFLCYSLDFESIIGSS